MPDEVAGDPARSAVSVGVNRRPENYVTLLL